MASEIAPAVLAPMVDGRREVDMILVTNSLFGEIFTSPGTFLSPPMARSQLLRSASHLR